MTVRSRVWDPDPHDAVHTDQDENVETRQSMGQAWSWQRRSSLSMGQAMPPWAGGVAMARARVVFPPLHDAEQADQADHSVTAQSTGHASALQTRDLTRAGQRTCWKLPSRRAKTLL